MRLTSRLSNVRTRFVLLVVAAVAASLTLSVAPAAADCAGPTIEHTAGAVDRGATITVTGTGFGDNCHDTGGPPAGEGFLGHPLEDVAIVLVQGGDEIVVAEVDADADYRFSVTAPVPGELEPGAVELIARWDRGASLFEPPAFDRTTESLTISDATAEAPGAQPTTTAPSSTTAAPASEPDDDDPDRVPALVPLGVALAVIAIALLVASRRR